MFVCAYVGITPPSPTRTATWTALEQHAEQFASDAASNPAFQGVLGDIGGAQPADVAGVPLGDIWNAVVQTAPEKPAEKKAAATRIRAGPAAKVPSANPDAIPGEHLKEQGSALQAALNTPREARPVITDTYTPPGTQAPHSLRLAMEDRYAVRYRLTTDYRLFAVEISGIDAGNLTIEAEGNAKQEAAGRRRRVAAAGPRNRGGRTRVELRGARYLPGHDAHHCRGRVSDVLGGAARCGGPGDRPTRGLQRPRQNAVVQGLQPHAGGRRRGGVHQTRHHGGAGQPNAAAGGALQPAQPGRGPGVLLRLREEPSMGWRRQFQDPGDIPTPVLERMAAVYNRGKLLPNGQ